METCLFLIQAALLEHKSMLTRWFLIPGDASQVLRAWRAAVIAN